MFVLSKLFDHVLLPPGLFIILILIGLFYYLFKRPRVFWLLLLSSLGLLYLVSIEPVMDILLRPLENRYPPLNRKEHLKAEYVVILGGGIIAHSPEESGGSSPSNAAMKRLIYGLRTANYLGLPVIVAGGAAFPEEYAVETEAEAGKRILLELGFQDDQILMETTSRNTWENGRNVKQLYNPETVVLVTSASHMPRSVLSFRKQGIRSISAPTDYRVINSPYTYRSYLPSVSALEGVHNALKEYVGLLYYRIRR